MIRKLAQAVLACAVAPALAFADPVTLSAVRGTFAVTGTLQSYDGAYYRVLTENGPVTLRGDAVTCSGAGCLAPGETTGFTFATTRSLAAVLAPALVRAFAAQNGLSVSTVTEGSGILFEVQGTGPDDRRFPVRLRVMSASEAFADLAAQASDFILVDRSVSGAERVILRDAGLGDMALPEQEYLLALDGLALLASPRQGLQTVSLGDLAASLAEPNPGWARLGGRIEGSLALTLRAEAEDLGRLTALLGPMQSPVAYRVDGFAVQQAVQQDPTRLGVVAASARGAGLALRVMESCGLGHAPDVAQIATGRYPWIVPIKAYLPDQRRPRELQMFLDFLGSDTAGAVLRRAGFAQPAAAPTESDLAERSMVGLRLAPKGQLPALQAVVTALSDAEPVGISLPAVAETGPLRGLRRLALDVLAQGIADGSLPPSRVLLLSSGPSPAQAEAYARTLLSDLRARLPQARAAELEQIRVLPDGALLPVACPGASWAAWMNARVDVWLLPATDTPAPEN